MNNYCVYKHTAPNGKVYIGITCQNPLRRWNNGKGYLPNKYFTSAILKYGWDNFKHEILYTNMSREEASQKEVELIKLYKSNNRKFGFNLSSGGEKSAAGCKRTIEFKKKISKALRERIIKDETRRKQSELKKGSKNPNYGKTPANIDSFRKAVSQFTKSGLYIKTYISITQAANETGIALCNIAACCRNSKHRKTAGGYIWKFESGGVAI